MMVRQSLLALLCVGSIALRAQPADAFTVGIVFPQTCQTAPLLVGSPCYINGTNPIASVPLAMAGGTLVQTSPADAANGSFSLQLSLDERAEVYLCYDQQGFPPTWMSSWVLTDMVVPAGSKTYSVYAKRSGSGSLTLGANSAGSMYFVVAKSAVPTEPRNGWVLLSYDMPYLREVIKHAPEYNVNHIQLSHDILMFAQDVLQQPQRRNDVNELIDLAHAYGVAEVTLWTHEMATRGMPPNCYSGNLVDGNNPATWAWMQSQYQQLFTAGTGCPQADGIVLTFDELSMFHDGVEVYDRTMFKHDGNTPTQSLAMVINKLQAVLRPLGKSLYVRTWGGQWQDEMRDAILSNGDKSVWIMNKNVGDVNGQNSDWLFMDSYNPVIGTLPADYKEMIEFDVCGEYLGRGPYTFVMTSYLKQHWQRAVGLGADGAVARIDRGGSLPYYTANRISLQAMAEIVPNPAADPAAVNLAFCNRLFPADMAQDIAWHYDAPNTAQAPWDGDTRYLAWKAFWPGLNNVTTQAQAISIGQEAIRKIDRHRARLERQTTLDIRGGRSDYKTLHDGIAVSVLDLGGSVPAAWNFANFRPVAATTLTPDCTIQVRADSPGLKVSTVTCEYSTNEGARWNSWPATCTGSDGTLATQTITAAAVPFNQASETRNYIRFRAENNNRTAQYDSGPIQVATVNGPTWGLFRPTVTSLTAPVCSLSMLAGDLSLNTRTARCALSADGGATWQNPATTWAGRYEATQLPTQSGWTLLEGTSSYATVNSGVLRVNDPSTSSGSKSKFAVKWNVPVGGGATVLARMRCASGGHWLAGNIYVSDGTHGEGFYLKAGGMAGLANCGVVAPVDATQWHVYRITIQGTDLVVYCDEQPVPLINAKGSFLLGSGEQQLIIGSGSSDGTQDIYYDYVYWTAAGAFAPDPWRPASFTGTPSGGTVYATVPFNQVSDTLNKVRFSIEDAGGHRAESPVYTVRLRSAAVWADLDCDGDVDQEDFAFIQACVDDQGLATEPGCEGADANEDGDVDQYDLLDFADCIGGPNAPPACN